MNITRITTFLFSFFLTFSFLTFVFADNEVKLSIQPITPKTQNKKIQSYFDFKAEPNKTYNLELLIRNDGDKSVKIDMIPTNGLTAKNGGIYYSDEWNKEENGLLDENHKISGNIKIQKNATIPANSSVKIPLTIKAPNDENGIYLGGINFFPDIEKVENLKEKENITFKLRNKQALALAVKLDMPKPEKERFSFGKVKAPISAAGIQFLTRMNNESATITMVQSFSFEAKDKKGKTVLKKEFKNIKFAPSSYTNFSILQENINLKPGVYTVFLKAKIGKKTISFEDTFEIKEKELNDHIDKKDESEKEIVEKEVIPKWLLITILICFPFIGFIFFLLGRKRSEK